MGGLRGLRGRDEQLVQVCHVCNICHVCNVCNVWMSDTNPKYQISIHLVPSLHHPLLQSLIHPSQPQCNVGRGKDHDYAHVTAHALSESERLNV